MEEKKKLYIVEDDGNIRRELQSYLAAAGYQVDCGGGFFQCGCTGAGGAAESGFVGT